MPEHDVGHHCLDFPLRLHLENWCVSKAHFRLLVLDVDLVHSLLELDVDDEGILVGCPFCALELDVGLVQAYRPCILFLVRP